MVISLTGVRHIGERISGAPSPARPPSCPLDVTSSVGKATECHIEWTRGSRQEADQDRQDSFSMMITGPSGLLFLY